REGRTARDSPAPGRRRRTRRPERRRPRRASAARKSFISRLGGRCRPARMEWLAGARRSQTFARAGVGAERWLPGVLASVCGYAPSVRLPAPRHHYTFTEYLEL